MDEQKPQQQNEETTEQQNEETLSLTGEVSDKALEAAVGGVGDNGLRDVARGPLKLAEGDPPY